MGPADPEKSQQPITAPPGAAQEFEGIARVPTEMSACSSSLSINNGGEKVRTIEDPRTEAPAAERITTARTAKSSIVPRAKRRGMLGQLALIPEIEVPTEYSQTIKWTITLVVAAGGAGAPMASGILYPALGPIAKELHSNATLTNLSVALYMLAMAIFPLWWSAFAERSGRRTVYIISFTLYVISSICAAKAVNIGMLIAFRVASGATAASLQAVGAGTISDIFESRERGKAMGYFYLGPLCGPLLSPIIGGALTQRFGWRSTQWFLAIYGVCELLLMIFCLPETLRKKAPAPHPVAVDVALDKETGADGGPATQTLSRVSTRTKVAAKTWLTTVREVVVDPMRALLFLTFPPVALTVYWASLTFGCLFILNISIQETFGKDPYNFSVLIVGLCYIPGSLGYICSSIVGGKWNDQIMRRRAVARKEAAIADGEAGQDSPLVYRPEDRMGANAWMAGILFPTAMIWYGWVVQEKVLWVAAMFATFSFGVGSMMVFSMATTMLTEFVPGKSASAVAVNNFCRNIFSCVGSVVAQPIIAAIGNGWLMTILCILGWTSLFVPFVMQKYGPGWRARASAGEYKYLK